jgi:hypothetical protein
MTADPADVPLWATPEGKDELERWHTEDPDGYARWLDEQWAADPHNPENSP